MDSLNRNPNQTFNEDKDKDDKKVFIKCKQAIAFKSKSNPKNVK